jgi:hypothetical protein
MAVALAHRAERETPMRKVLLALMAAAGFAVALAVVGNPERAQAIYCYQDTGEEQEVVGVSEKFDQGGPGPSPECSSPTPTTTYTPPPIPPPTTPTPPPPTTTAPAPVPPPPPPTTPSIPSSALPPDSVAEFDGAGQSGEFYASIIEKCKWSYAGIRFKNRITGNVYWTYRVSHTFCYMGNMITKVYGQVGESISAQWPWFFHGNLTPPQTSGGLTSRTTYAQGRYEACVSPHVGCIVSRAPWVRLTAYGGGTFSYTWGIG